MISITNSTVIRWSKFGWIYKYKIDPWYKRTLQTQKLIPSIGNTLRSKTIHSIISIANIRQQMQMVLSKGYIPVIFSKMMLIKSTKVESSNPTPTSSTSRSRTNIPIWTVTTAIRQLSSTKGKWANSHLFLHSTNITETSLHKPTSQSSRSKRTCLLLKAWCSTTDSSLNLI